MRARHKPEINTAGGGGEKSIAAPKQNQKRALSEEEQQAVEGEMDWDDVRCVPPNGLCLLHCGVISEHLLDERSTTLPALKDATAMLERLETRAKKEVHVKIGVDGPELWELLPEAFIKGGYNDASLAMNTYWEYMKVRVPICPTHPHLTCECLDEHRRVPLRPPRGRSPRAGARHERGSARRGGEASERV